MRAAAPFPRATVDHHVDDLVKRSVTRALAVIRKYLDMDVAFVVQFLGQSRVFRYVDSESGRPPFRVGDSFPLDDGYCKKVVDGLLPELIADTSQNRIARTIPETTTLPIGSHLSVPLYLSDGRLYGTFCCFSHNARKLEPRDLGAMRAFAEFLAFQIDGDIAHIRALEDTLTNVTSALHSDQPAAVFQPTYCLRDNRLIGAESLSRFHIEPRRSPDVWFAEASKVGLNVDLELKSIRNALRDFSPLWGVGDHYLGVNCSPLCILDPRLQAAIADHPGERIVIEITEHDHVEDYAALHRALKPLRDRGVRIAIDDAGSGYSSMRHILNIQPDLIKLDISLTRDIDTDRTRYALASALCEFGRQTGCSLIAEGIETEAELLTLGRIGVHAAQGYFLGHPMPISEFRALLDPARLAS